MFHKHSSVMLGFIAIILGTISACDENHIESTTEAQTACISLQTQITVGDGYFRALCGCDESSTAYIRSGQTLNCTVPSGTTLFFDYSGAHLKHQLISTGTPSFGSSALSDPSDLASAKNFAIKLDTVGTYSFFDPFNPGITGTLVVR